MKMNFTARQMKVYDAVKENASKKLSKFEKFFSDDAEMDITFSMPNDLEKVEVTIRSQGFVFRAEEGADTFATAIDRVTDALERQIRKNKTRLKKRIREEGFELLEATFPNDSEEEYFIDDVKVKSFPIKPMSLDEAILQMNMIGHDFYVYKDATSYETCVVYKRKAGGYGVIVPEV